MPYTAGLTPIYFDFTPAVKRGSFPEARHRNSALLLTAKTQHSVAGDASGLSAGY